MCYHPSANLVACTNGGKIWILNRKTGVVLEDRLDPTQAWKEVRQILFTPDGKRLLVNHVHPKLGRSVEVVSLKLSPTELEDAARGPQSPVVSAQPVSPKQPVDQRVGAVNELEYAPADDFGADSGDKEAIRTWTDNRGKNWRRRWSRFKTAKLRCANRMGKSSRFPWTGLALRIRILPGPKQAARNRLGVNRSAGAACGNIANWKRTKRLNSGHRGCPTGGWLR